MLRVHDEHEADPVEERQRDERGRRVPVPPRQRAQGADERQVARQMQNLLHVTVTVQRLHRLLIEGTRYQAMRRGGPSIRSRI